MSLDVTIEDLLMDEVVIDFDMFCAGMEHGIRGEGESTKVVNP